MYSDVLSEGNKTSFKNGLGNGAALCISKLSIDSIFECARASKLRLLSGFPMHSRKYGGMMTSAHTHFESVSVRRKGRERLAQTFPSSFLYFFFFLLLRVGEFLFARVLLLLLIRPSTQSTNQGWISLSLSLCP